jgi:hypothetical protein
MGDWRVRTCLEIRSGSSIHHSIADQSQPLMMSSNRRRKTQRIRGCVGIYIGSLRTQQKYHAGVRIQKKLKTEPHFPLLHHLPTDWPQRHNWLARRPWSHLTQLHKSCVGGVVVSNFFRIFFTNKNGKKIPSNPLPNFAPQSEKLTNNQHL